MNFNKKDLLVLSFILLAVVLRLVPHWPNVTPVTAMALFGGAFFSNRYAAIAVPLIIMALSDMFLGFSWITFFVYSSFVIVSLIGLYYKKMTFKTILLSSLSFFIITNFGVWLLGYPKTWTGLAECYTLALPFFRNSLIGDFVYNGIMLYGYRYAYKHLLQEV